MRSNRIVCLVLFAAPRHRSQATSSPPGVRFVLFACRRREDRDDAPTAVFSCGGPMDEVIIPAPAARRGRVLVIDDEPMILKVVCRVLEAVHAVVAVPSAGQALALIEKGERYDAILCDLMMPQMTGMDFHAAVLRIDPAIASKMIFLTGGAFTAGMRAFLDRVPNQRLEKPFNVESLKTLIAAAIK